MDPWGWNPSTFAAAGTVSATLVAGAIAVYGTLRDNRLREQNNRQLYELRMAGLASALVTAVISLQAGFRGQEEAWESRRARLPALGVAVAQFFLGVLFDDKYRGSADGLMTAWSWNQRAVQAQFVATAGLPAIAAAASSLEWSGSADMVAATRAITDAVADMTTAYGSPGAEARRAADQELEKAISAFAVVTRRETGTDVRLPPATGGVDPEPLANAKSE